MLSIHPTTSKPVYSKMYLWAHRNPCITATFLQITHPHGHLNISAKYLILSGGNKTSVPADSLGVGDIIYFLSEEETQMLIPVSVLHIHTCTQVGYYTPFTNNGLILVDNIASSVYCHTQSLNNSWSYHTLTRGLVQQFGIHRVGQCVLAPVRVGCKLGLGHVLSEQVDTYSHIHKYCQWLQEHF